MRSRAILAAVLETATMLVIAGCSKKGEAPRAAVAESREAAALSTAASAPDGCAGVGSTSLGAGRLAGPYVVPGDKQIHTYSFPGGAETAAVLVVQNGDGSGNGSAVRAIATTQIVTSLDETADLATADGKVRVRPGETDGAGEVPLAAANTLSVKASGGGTVRVSVASLGSAPCPVVDLTLAKVKGAEKTVSRDFARPDGKSLARLPEHSPSSRKQVEDRIVNTDEV